MNTTVPGHAPTIERAWRRRCSWVPGSTLRVAPE